MHNRVQNTPLRIFAFLVFSGGKNFGQKWLNFLYKGLYPFNIYLFKINNRNIGKRCEICSKLTIKALERGHWRRSGVFIVNFEHISHLFLVFLLLILNK